MRTRYWPILALVLLAAFGFSEAAAGDFGLGIIVGEPTGICAKNWLSQTTAWDAAAAWSFEGEDAFHLHGDFLLHNFRLLSAEGQSIPFYYGLGFRLLFHDNDHRDHDNDDDAHIGVRIPLGLAYMLRSGDLDFFFEVAPTMDLAPDTDFHINGGVGVRYYF